MISKKQQIARANFKKAIKEAQALRKKNPKLTQTEALKKAFADSKKVGATNYYGTGEKVYPVKLKIGQKYEWIEGAEYLELKYIGLSKNNPTKKFFVKFGNGEYLFQFDDGRYIGLSYRTILESLKTIPKKVGAVKNKILGALPIDFKGSFYGYKFKIINQYQIDGGVTSQIISIDDGKLVAELSGNPLENKRAVNALVSLGLPRSGFSYTSKDEKEAERRISRFVVDLNKEVKDYNTGKDTTKKKSKGLKLVVKTQTKKLAVIDQIKSILKTDKKILKGGYKIKTGIIREKKVISGMFENMNISSKKMYVRIWKNAYIWAGSFNSSKLREYLKTNVGKYIEIETEFLFNNQYNTIDGYRLYDAHIDLVKNDARDYKNFPNEDVAFLDWKGIKPILISVNEKKIGSYRLESYPELNYYRFSNARKTINFIFWNDTYYIFNGVGYKKSKRITGSYSGDSVPSDIKNKLHIYLKSEIASK